MKSTIKTSRTAGALEKYFRALNNHYFNGELPEVIITLKATPSAYGHFSCGKVWQAGDTAQHEINISTYYLNRPIEDVVATLLHEMVHLFCSVNGIKDTSNNGLYHNQRFKEAAESHGLMIEKAPKTYGWTITTPSLELLDFIEQQGWNDFQMAEGGFIHIGRGPVGGTAAGGTTVKPPKKPSNSRKYVCPKCGTIIRATREVNVICGDCNVKFEQAE